MRSEYQVIKDFVRKPNPSGLADALNRSYELKLKQQLVPQRVQSFLSKCMQLCGYSDSDLGKRALSSKTNTRCCWWSVTAYTPSSISSRKNSCSTKRGTNESKTYTAASFRRYPAAAWVCSTQANRYGSSMIDAILHYPDTVSKEYATGWLTSARSRRQCHCTATLKASLE